jgi:hypothetical protein
MARFEYECETVCNDRTIYPAMQVLVEKEGITANAAAKFIEKDSGGKITAGRAKMVWSRRKGVTDVTDSKAAKIARAAARAIKAGEMTVDDVREISESIGEAIEEHDLPDRAGTQVERGLKLRRRERARQSAFGRVTSKGNFERLWKHLMATADGLTYFADQTIKPTTEDDVIAMKGILAALPDLVIQCIRLGVDVVGLYETFVAPRHLRREKELKDVTPKGSPKQITS